MYEIIHVVETGAFRGQARALEIEAVEDRPLPAGYYFVLLPDKKPGAKRRTKRYFGPLPTACHARLLLVSARTLGLVDEHCVQAAITECRSVARSAANDSRTAPPNDVNRRQAGAR